MLCYKVHRYSDGDAGLCVINNLITVPPLLYRSYVSLVTNYSFGAEPIYFGGLAAVYNELLS